jgi:hypothetical protein
VLTWRASRLTSLGQSSHERRHDDLSAVQDDSCQRALLPPVRHQSPVPAKPARQPAICAHIPNGQPCQSSNCRNLYVTLLGHLRSTAGPSGSAGGSPAANCTHERAVATLRSRRKRAG